MAAVKSHSFQREGTDRHIYIYFFSAEKCKIGQPFSFKISFSPSLDPYVDLIIVSHCRLNVAVSSVLHIHHHFINHI